MILFIIISLIIGGLFFFDMSSSKLDESLYILNKSSIMILCWKLLHTFFTLINIVTQPLFLIINNMIMKKFYALKNLIVLIANIDNSDNSDENYKKELVKMNEEMSNMSDYFCKSKSKSKSKGKSIKNDKVIESNNNTNLNDHTKSKINQDKNTSSSSKCVMEKKIEEINKLIDETNTENIEDMTLTLNDDTNK
jgi:hypothetical protein